jgi:hypothetical protein
MRHYTIGSFALQHPHTTFVSFGSLATEAFPRQFRPMSAVPQKRPKILRRGERR